MARQDHLGVNWGEEMKRETEKEKVRKQDLESSLLAGQGLKLLDSPGLSLVLLFFAL